MPAAKKLPILDLGVVLFRDVVLRHPSVRGRLRVRCVAWVTVADEGLPRQTESPRHLQPPGGRQWKDRAGFALCRVCARTHSGTQ